MEQQYRASEIELPREASLPSPNGMALKLAAAAALALFAWAVVANLPDIKRYIKISMM